MNPDINSGGTYRSYYVLMG